MDEPERGIYGHKTSANELGPFLPCTGLAAACLHSHTFTFNHTFLATATRLQGYVGKTKRRAGGGGRKGAPLPAPPSDDKNICVNNSVAGRQAWAPGELLNVRGIQKGEGRSTHLPRRVPGGPEAGAAAEEDARVRQQGVHRGGPPSIRRWHAGRMHRTAALGGQGTGGGALCGLPRHVAGGPWTRELGETRRGGGRPGQSAILYHVGRTKSRCEVPMRFTPGWHSGDAGVCLWAVHGATELRVFTVVAFCAAWNVSELRLRSTPRYRLVCNRFPDPGRGLP